MLNHTLEIRYDEDRFVSEFLMRNTKVLIPFINHETMTIFGVDLTVLPIEPVDIRTAFVRWLIKVNEPRLRVGKDLLITYDIIKRCPLWKVVPMPFRAISLSKPDLQMATGKPAILGSTPPRGSIGNKRPTGPIGSSSKRGMSK